MHFFNIATNLTNGPFMIGYEAELDNFYIKGEIINNSPYISCRIFNSDGILLFEITKNILSQSFADKFNIKTDTNYFAVLDTENNTLLKVHTLEEKGKSITYIEGQFFDKKGKLAAKGDERGLLLNCPLRM
jgi:hypothetical protein